MRRFLPDNFTLSLLGTVALASLLPATGQAEAVVNFASKAALVMLFFLHGARLPVEAVVAGLKRPVLHASIAACTFILFPVLCLAMQAIVPWLLPEPLWLGLLFVSCLPSTVQSSIAFTSIAGGNVPVAICAATASNIVGVFITPALVSFLLHRDGAGGGFGEVGRIMLQLLLPFVVGMVLRRWIGGWVAAKKGILTFVDRGSILLAVYVAFGEAVTQGIWHLFTAQQFAGLIVANAILLGAVLIVSSRGSRLVGLPLADEIAVMFCGSKKSLASGVPMASILFGSSAGVTVLPIMIFHQMQLMVCAVLARRYAEKTKALAATQEPSAPGRKEAAEPRKIAA